MGELHANTATGNKLFFHNKRNLKIVLKNINNEKINPKMNKILIDIICHFFTIIFFFIITQRKVKISLCARAVIIYQVKNNYCFRTHI